jgi:hypothetical protein
MATDGNRLNDPASVASRARRRLAKAKRVEAEAHRRAAELHEQTAELQRHLGHEAEAQAARARAARAHDLHDLALIELAGWELSADS